MAAEIVVLTTFSLSLESYCFNLGRCLSRCGTQLSSWVTLLTWGLCFSPVLAPLFSKPHVIFFLDCQLLLNAWLPRIVSWFSPLFPLVLPPRRLLHLYLQLKFSSLLLCFDFLDLFFFLFVECFFHSIFVCLFQQIFFALHSFFSPKVAFLSLFWSVLC